MTTTTQTPTPLVIVARWQVQPDRVDAVLAHVAVLRQASLAEPGCLGYEVFRAVDAPDTLLLHESYADDAALEAHRQSAHYQAGVVGQILPLLAGRQVQVLQRRT